MSIVNNLPATDESQLDTTIKTAELLSDMSYLDFNPNNDNDLAKLSEYTAEMSISGWTEIFNGFNISNENHYQGIAFYRKVADGIEVFIANRGSQDKHDFGISDTQLALGIDPPSDSDALKFYNTVIKTLQETENVNISSINVIETGHSLGGQEADYVLANVANSPDSKPNIEAITFNAPGIAFKDINADKVYNAVNFSTSGEGVHIGGMRYAGHQITINSPSRIPTPMAFIAGYLINPYVGVAAALSSALGWNHKIGLIEQYLNQHSAVGDVDITDHQPLDISQTIIDDLQAINNNNYLSLSSEQKKSTIDAVFNQYNSDAQKAQSAPASNTETFTSSDNGSAIQLTGSIGDVINITTNDNSVSISTNNGTQLVAYFDSTTDQMSDDNWSSKMVSQASDFYAPDGSFFGNTQYINGTYESYYRDPIGNSIIDYYDKAGNLLKDVWTHNDGTHGENDFLPFQIASSDVTQTEFSTEIDTNSNQQTVTRDGNNLITETISSAGVVSSYVQGGVGAKLTNNSIVDPNGYAVVYPDADHMDLRQYKDANGRVISLAEVVSLQGDYNLLNSYNSNFNFSGSSSFLDIKLYGNSNTPHPNDFSIIAHGSSGEIISCWSAADGTYGYIKGLESNEATGINISATGISSKIQVTQIGGIIITNSNNEGLMSVDTWNNDGTYTISIPNQTGSSVIYLYSITGNLTVTQYDSNGNIISQENSNNAITASPDGSSFIKVPGQNGEINIIYQTGEQSINFGYNSSGVYTYSESINNGAIFNKNSEYQSQLESFSPSNDNSIAIKDNNFTTTIINNRSYREYFNNTGALTSDTWNDVSGNHGYDVYNSDKSSSGTSYTADGSYSTYQNDGAGNNLTSAYDKYGTFTGDAWQKNDGSNGYDNYNSDGSTFSKSINSDGSYLIFKDDGKQNTATFYFNTAGTKTADIWRSNDGSSGTDYYNSDGSSSGTKLYPDGTSLGYSIDANGNSKYNYYNPNGILTSYTWNNTDGSHGVTTYSEKGLINSTTVNVDGSKQTTSDDGNGNITENFFDKDGNPKKTQWTTSDGGHGEIDSDSNGSFTEIIWGSNGSKQTTSKDTYGNITTERFDTQGNLTYRAWTDADGSSGQITFNTDGSRQQKNTNIDGSYSVISTDAVGNITTDQYENNGFLTKHLYQAIDGTSSSTVYQHDGSNITTNVFTDGSKEIKTILADGSSDDKFYDQSSKLVAENWENSLGQSGSFKVNSDGTTTVTTRQSNGSYEVAITDSLNNKIDSYYSPKGVLQYDIRTDFNGNVTKKIYVDGNESATLYKTDTIYTTSVFQKSGGTLLDFDANGPNTVYINDIGPAQRTYNFYSGTGSSDGFIAVKFNPMTGYGGAFAGTLGLRDYFRDKSGESIYQPDGSYLFSGSFNFMGKSGFSFNDNQYGNEIYSISGSNYLSEFPDPSSNINWSTYKVTYTTNNGGFGDTSTQDSSSIPIPPWVRSISQIDSMTQLGNNEYFAIIEGQSYLYNGQVWSPIIIPPGDTGYAVVSNGQLLKSPTENITKTITYQFNSFITTGNYTESDIIKTNSYGAQSITSQTSSWSWDGGHGSNTNGQWIEYLDNGWSYNGNTIRDQNGNVVYQTNSNSYLYSASDAYSSLLVSGKSVWFSDTSGDKFQYSYSYIANPDANSYYTGTVILSGYSWILADGTYGNASFNVNGTGSGITHYEDGSYSTSYDDGVGNFIVKNFSTSGIILSDMIGSSDGSIIQTTFNNDGSSLGSTQFSDGLSSSYTNDGNGNIKTKYYSQDGILVGSGTINTSSSPTNTISLLSSDVAVEFGDQTSKILPANGNDTILGGNGNDTILTGSGTDSIALGNGNDSLYLTGGQSTISLGNGQDTVLGTNSNYTISVGDGADSIRLGYGNNQLVAGNGNDTILLGDGNSTITLGNGNDSISLNNGSDSLSVGSGNCTITTISGNDTIQLGDGSSSITLGTGNSIISAGNGNNNIRIGNGSDTVMLGSGNDSIAASDGNYYLMLGDGMDTINLGRGSSTLELGGGNDFISIVSGYDTVTAGDGSDTLQLGTASVALTLGNGNSLILASSGNNTIQVGDGANKIVSGNGTNTIHAGDGMDSIYLGTGLDSVILGNGNDSIYGSTGSYSIQLGNGNDTIGLINSQSNIFLGNGKNTLSLNGGSNNATLGNGDNLIALGTGSDTITMGNGTNSVITNTGNHSITGGDGANTLNLGAGFDTIILGNGNDTLSGVNSSYSIHVGNGNDSIHLGTGSDSITAGNGNDTVSVGVGNSTITLGDGNNRLTVGSGNNILSVGNGNDTIQTSTGNNLIVVGTGQDVISDVGGNDTLQLVSGVSYQDIWLMKSGNNLIIDEYKAGATVTVTNWFASNYYQLASIESGDGKILLQNQVASLVQAMAAFSPPTSGSTSLPTNTQASIAPLVASSWH